jgi:hypothetical protein
MAIGAIRDPHRDDASERSLFNLWCGTDESLGLSATEPQRARTRLVAATLLPRSEETATATGVVEEAARGAASVFLETLNV